MGLASLCISLICVAEATAHAADRQSNFVRIFACDPQEEIQCQNGFLTLGAPMNDH